MANNLIYQMALAAAKRRLEPIVDNESDKFIILIDTRITLNGSASNTLRLPLMGTDMLIEWGDGSSETVTKTVLPTTDFATWVEKVYTTPGIYIVKVSNALQRVYYNGIGDRSKLQEIKQFGTVVWTSMERAFRGCNNMNITAIDTPNLSICTSLRESFRDCVLMSSDSILNWDVSTITTFREGLRSCTAFNHPIAWTLNASVITLDQCFKASGLSPENYSRTLIHFANYVYVNNYPLNVNFTLQDSMIYNTVEYTTGNQFNDGVSARNYLLTRGWTISNDTLQV